MNPELLQI